MSEPGYAAYPRHTQGGEAAKELDNYPEAENKNRRHPHQTHKVTQSHQADHSGPGEEDKIGS